MNTVFPPSPTVVIPILGSALLFPVRRVYCVGRNYSAHALEMGHSEREAPFFFSKPADALVVNPETVNYPTNTKELHYEVELVIAIGKSGGNIEPEKAWNFVYGYSLGIDFTKRDLQRTAKEMGRPWDLSKGFDQAAPISSIVPKEKYTSDKLESGHLELYLDKELKQLGNTSEMIWSIPEIVCELSKHIELKPGDLIFTGTPSGVGEVVKGQEISAHFLDLNLKLS